MSILGSIANTMRRRHQQSEPNEPAPPAETGTAAFPPIDPVQLAKEHALSDFTGAAIGEPACRFLYNRAVGKIRVAYRSDHDLRAAQAQLAEAEHAMQTAELAVAHSRGVSPGTGISTEAQEQSTLLAERRLRKAQAETRRLEQATAAIGVALSDNLAVRAETELASEINAYVLTFNAERRHHGLAELEPLPTDLVQRVVTEAVQPLTPNADDTTESSDPSEWAGA